MALTLLLLCLCGCAVTPAYEAGYQPRADGLPAGQAGKPLVVVVHGIFDDGRKMRPLITFLEEKGYACFAPELKPGNAYHGIRDLALKLRTEIDAQIGPERDFAMVGFSMGGLVSRYYLQELGGAERCRALVTISSPHRGTLLGYALPSRGVEEMRPGSDFLESLNSDTSLEPLDGMPVYSYYTPLDLVIIPARNSEWARAENQRFRALLHPLMVSEQAVLERLGGDLDQAFGR